MVRRELYILFGKLKQWRIWAAEVPRIYTALDNKQVEFQSHMIEVEGMINNRPLVILIDSGASHSYVDPRVVESLHLTKRKHEKSWLV
jgi:hypothetical protein